ncbi:DinB family protein [Aquimarina pacifica]|uniref:DinB family protein n=1 Tax=Aquimarina pacifica TaxID=1296415 RepID=UPI00047279AA|nr:DinB family protein [Aquimarina pacifica]
MDIEDIVSQFEEVFEGTPWYGLSILKSVEAIPVKFWDQRSKGVAHTIAELIVHVIDWRVFVIEKLKENQSYSISMNSEMDWRKDVSVTNEAEKIEGIKQLKKTQGEIIQLLSKKPDSWMSEFVLGKDYKNEYMMQGILQHDIYHLGQINLLFATLKDK